MPSTSKPAATKKAPATKASTAAAKEANAPGFGSGRHADLRAARQFAMECNFGLASRTREMLDSNALTLQALVEIGEPLLRIRDFVHQRYGPKIGPKALQTYLDALKSNYGMPLRTRETLDEYAIVLAVLVEESVNLFKIRDFIERRYGLKVAPEALQAYLDAKFPRVRRTANDMPAKTPTKPAAAKSVTKKAAPKKSAKKVARKTAKKASRTKG